MDATCKQLAFIAGMKSFNTIVDWRSYFREMCSVVIDHEQIRIGGPNMTVEIDETLFSPERHMWEDF
jgi:hypothetical protein